MDLTPQELCLLGRCELRLGRLEAAELHLLRSHLLGVPEASLEYGVVLRMSGQLERSLKHFRKSVHTMHDRWKWLALHEQARVEWLMGDGALAAEHCEAAVHALLALGDEEGAGQANILQAEMTAEAGQAQRAEHMLLVSLSVLDELPDPGPRLRALLALLYLYILVGEELKSGRLIQEIKTLADASALVWPLAWLLRAQTLQACLYQSESVDRLLAEAARLKQDVHDAQWQEWLSLQLAERAGRAGKRVEALSTLTRRADVRRPQVRQMLGRLALLEEDVGGARGYLHEALASFERAGRWLDAALTRLDLVWLEFQTGQEDAATHELRGFLSIALTLPYRHALQLALVQRLGLQAWARSVPGLGFQIAALEWTETASVPPHVRVKTFGRQEVWVGGREVGNRVGAAVLALLILEPGRTRREIELALFPDRPPQAAASAIKTAMYLMRQDTGLDIIVAEGPYQHKKYCLSPHIIFDSDWLQFMDALRTQDIYGALHVYEGDFLPHLDAPDWARLRGVEARERLQTVLFRKIEYWKQRGQWNRIKILCDHYLAIDPDDILIHETRSNAQSCLTT